MVDKLKQFIDDNRDAFDSESPSTKVFRKLKEEITDERNPKDMAGSRFMHWAAAVVGLVIVSIILYYTMQRNNTDVPLREQQFVKEALPVDDPVYTKQINQYQELIGLQQTELRKIEKDEPELYRQFSGDINQLDSAYRVLKTTLTTNPNKELLLEAMISNLQLQTELLNRQLSIIKEIKQKSKA